MSPVPHPPRSNPPDSGDIGDLARAAVVRREATWQLSMSERLAQVHRLCKQINAVNGAAQTR